MRGGSEVSLVALLYPAQTYAKLHTSPPPFKILDFDFKFKTGWRVGGRFKGVQTYSKPFKAYSEIIFF